MTFELFVDIFAIITIPISIICFIVSWKQNVISKKDKKNLIKYEFYDEPECSCENKNKE